MPPMPPSRKRPSAGRKSHRPGLGADGRSGPLKDLSAKAAPVVDDAAAPSVTDKDEGNPNFQGYMPGWTPPEPGKSMLDSLPMLPGAPIGMHRQ